MVADVLDAEAVAQGLGVTLAEVDFLAEMPADMLRDKVPEAWAALVRLIVHRRAQ